MKPFFTILLALLMGLSGAAQGYNVDSLKVLLSTAKADSNRVLLLYYMGVQMLRSNIDSAFALSNQGIQLAQQIAYPKGELLCKMNMARCFWSIGDFNSSIQLVLQNLQRIEKLRDTLVEVDAIAALQDSYRDLGEYDQALKYALKNNDKVRSIEGGRYQKIHEAAIASIYLVKGDMDSTNFYLKRAMAYPKSDAFDGWIYGVAGNFYAKLQKFDSAYHYYRLSVATLPLSNNLKDLAGTYNSLTSLFMTAGKYDSALHYAYKSLSLTKENAFDKEELEASLMLSKLYEPIMKDSALHYYKAAIAIKDSLYNEEKQKQLISFQFNERLKQQELQYAQAQYKAQFKIYLLLGAIGIATIIGLILWRSYLQKQKAYSQLKATQAQLIQSEKMASLGELTAGIAHEIQNPLNFVNNFSETNIELLQEAKTELKSGNTKDGLNLLDSIEENEQKINQHGKRADGIVKGMLQHSRKNTGKKEPTIINALADEYLRLAYHGFRAKDKDFNVKIETHFDETIGKISIVPQDIGRVLLNLYNNAFFAVAEREKQIDESYEPTISVSTKRLNGKIEIRVADNGMGISKNVLDKIFQPFFTTKPTGQGTGLGLSLSYDIVKAHGGELKVESTEGEGTTFEIQLQIA